jgi:hypothetical protein
MESRTKLCTVMTSLCFPTDKEPIPVLATGESSPEGVELWGP